MAEIGLTALLLDVAFHAALLCLAMWWGWRAGKVEGESATLRRVWRKLGQRCKRS